MVKTYFKKGIVIGIILIFFGASVFPCINGSIIKKSYQLEFENKTSNNLLNGWSEQAKLLPDDGDAGDAFGVRVSIYNDYAIIGAPYDNVYGDKSGSAYIFKRTDTTWIQEAKLIPSDGDEGEHFGWSVYIDGEYAIISAPRDDELGDYSGSAYIFKRDGSIWTQEAKLIPSDGDEGLIFGNSVSINGEYAIIGSYDDDNGPGSGSAYIFKRDGSIWTQEAKLIPSDGDEGDYFGGIVSIDGDYALISAMWDDENGLSSGSAYIFKNIGSTWTQEAKLLPSDGDEYDEFGGYVSIDNEYALIGAPGSDSAYIFKRLGTTWTEEAKLTPSDPARNFGVSVSISGDTAMVGAFRDDDNGDESGSVFVFKNSGSTWNEEMKLFPSDPDTGDWFGESVSIDGNYAVICGVFNDDNGMDSGSAYIFHKEIENQPPLSPIINGPTTLKINEEGTFSVSAIDPDDDQVYFYIDWGGGSSVDWDGPHDSEQEVEYKHTWTTKDTYTILVKAKDIYDSESDYAEFEIKITNPRVKSLTRSINIFQYLQRLLLLLTI